MKLLRTIRLDASDTFIFDPPAEPGELAVSGAFVFSGRFVEMRSQALHFISRHFTKPFGSFA